MGVTSGFSSYNVIHKHKYVLLSDLVVIELVIELVELLTPILHKLDKHFFKISNMNSNIEVIRVIILLFPSALL